MAVWCDPPPQDGLPDTGGMSDRTGGVEEWGA